MARFPKRILNSRNRDGMSLIEIMVVVIIMGMIATIVMRSVLSSRDRARALTARVQISVFKDALADYYSEHSHYPATLQGLITRSETVKPEAYWPENGYLDASGIPLDPWNNKYDYIMPGLDHSYEIICYGRDGVDGGEGPDADIKSWELVNTEEPE